MASNRIDRQAWEVIVEQKDEIKRLRRNRLFSLVKPVAIAWSVGIFTPMIFQFAVVWLLPTPIKETITVVHGVWADVALGLQCTARK
jgi:hypothetical protein